jgi:hypothetical protein
MQQVGDVQHEDLLRAFFRLHLSNFGLLFPHVAEIISRASSQDPAGYSSLVSEANHVVIVSHIVKLPFTIAERISIDRLFVGKVLASR